MIAPPPLDTLDAQQMRQALLSLMGELAIKDEQLQRAEREAVLKQARIDKLTHELAVLKRLKFAATSEKFSAGMPAEQRSLPQDSLDADLAEVCAEIEKADTARPKEGKRQPKHQALPPHLPRHEMAHEPDDTVCACGCQMKRIDKAYIWSYCSTRFSAVQAVVFDFAETRSGQNVRDLLRLGTDTPWRGTLVSDGFSGYHACFEQGVASHQCLAHARRKFHELWANHASPIGQRALKYFQRLFDYEDQVAQATPEERRRVRQRKSRRVAALLHRWLLTQRQLVPPGSATAKAIDYSLKRWDGLTRYIGDSHLPISNNWVENLIRPIALGRSNWLFAGSLRAGKRAAVMSQVHSARINGHEPYAYLKDVLERLPTHPASRIEELLPHRWRPCPSS